MAEGFTIRKSEFVLSAARVEQVPRDGLPQVAFAGRSNVGKSSLLNTLVNRRQFAKVSSTPGRTQLLNVFRINDAMYFVDLPGYGYAKAPQSARDQWRKLIERYLTTSRDLKVVVALFDIRRELADDDHLLLDWLRHQRIATVAVLTKADKLSRMRQQEARRRFEQEVGPYRVAGTCMFSTVTRTGREELMATIASLTGAG